MPSVAAWALFAGAGIAGTGTWALVVLGRFVRAVTSSDGSSKETCNSVAGGPSRNSWEWFGRTKTTACAIIDATRKMKNGRGAGSFMRSELALDCEHVVARRRSVKGRFIGERRGIKGRRGVVAEFTVGEVVDTEGGR